MQVFLAQLLLNDEWEIWEPHVVIASHGDKAQRFCMIARGSVTAWSNFRARETSGPREQASINRKTQTLRKRAVVTLNQGDYFGKYALIGDTVWGAEFKCACDFVTNEEVTELRTISVQKMQEILLQFPDIQVPLAPHCLTPFRG